MGWRWCIATAITNNCCTRSGHAEFTAGRGVYYTLSNPGRWAKKAKGHAPRLERTGNKIEVYTKHPMKGFKHYIVKHVILDRKFNYVTETIFDPGNDQPLSEYDVSKLDDTIYAVSLCNLHDAWVSALKL